MFYIIYLRFITKIAELFYFSKINISIKTLLMILFFLLSVIYYIFYFLYIYNYSVNLIESKEIILDLIDTMKDLSDLISDDYNFNNPDEFIKQRPINPYNNFYGIFNFDTHKLNIPKIELNDVSFHKYMKNEINFINNNNYRDILRFADYRYASLRHDIFNIINDSLKVIN